MIKQHSYGEVTRFDLARTLMGQGRYWTTAYWVDGLLIDSGCSHTAREMVRALKHLPLRCIVNTHSHEDHIGANALLQKQRAVEILAHPLAVNVLQNPRHEQPLHPYRRIFWGWPEACQARPLSDGEQICTPLYNFQVIFTAGHSQDHLCLFEPDRGWLFSGDLFVGGKDRALRDGCDIWAVISALEKIAELPLTMLFPGSARVRPNPVPELYQKIAFYRQLGEKVLSLHQSGCDINQIMSQLLGGVMWVEVATFGHFSRRCLVQAYLNKLDKEGGEQSC